MKTPAPRWIVFATRFYAVSTLFSQAAMSIGAAAVGSALLFWAARPASWPGVRNWARSMVSAQPLVQYYKVSLFLAIACFVSLLGLRIAPIRVEGFDAILPSWGRDLAKLWYFVWGPLLALALGVLSAEQQKRVWRAWAFAFLVFSIVGCLQFFTGWPRPQVIPNLPGRFHATLFIGHHLSVASIWIFPFFAILGAVFSKPIRDHWGLSRAFLAGLALLGFTVLILTFSRMLWLALPVGILVFTLLFQRGLRIKQVVWVCLGLCLAVSLAGQVPAIKDRMLSSMGSTERFALWRVNWKFFSERPLTGAGWHHNLELAGQVLRKERPEGPVFVGHAHNNAIDVLGALGSLGLVAWLVWNAWLARELVRLGFGVGVPAWVSDLSRAWLAAFVVFHLNGLTQVNFWEGKVQHQLFWVVGWVLLWRYRQTSTERVTGSA